MLFVVLVSVLFAEAICVNNDGGKAPRIPLNDGNAIPALGLGTFLGFDETGQKEVLHREVEDPVAWALNAGYRMIDTASLYKNEEQIGMAISRSPVPRENMFIVTKLGSNEQRDVVEALKGSLARLNLTYVDLYLIHFPISFTPDHTAFDVIDYVDTWRGMERVKQLGLAKSVGVSNFNETQLERLLEKSVIPPAVLQVEVNLNLAQTKMLNFCKSHNITVMAYTPFGSLFEESLTPPQPRINDPTLKKIADKYGKTVPQVVLRFLVQKGVIPIPKSGKKERIEENINIFDFELDDKEMEELGKFNKDYRVVHPSFWQDHPYYPFEKKDKPDPNIFKTKN